MATENDKNEGGAPPAGTAGEQKAPEPKAEPPKAEEKKAAPAAPPAKAEEKKDPPAPPAPKVLSADDDELPENDELFQLSKKALNARLARHTKRELKERFGTDDPDEIKVKLDKLAVFEEEAEKKRIAALSELEKEKDARAKAEARAKKAEDSYQRAVDAQAFAEYDSTATRVIGKYFDAEDKDTVEFVTDRLKKHVLGLDDKELKNPEKVFESWAKDYAKEHPKYAKKTEEQKPEEKQAPKKIALNTGSDPTRPERGDANLAQKTPKPGQPNSMTKAEYANYKRQRGISA